MRILYTIVFIHLLPVFVLRLFWRARKAPAYAKRIGERFALVAKRKDKAPLIWLHAVSVGEVIAAIPLLNALKAQNPAHVFCITTTTPTGSERVKAAFGDSVLHYYLPYDLPSLHMTFIRAIRPSVLIVMETELWPNLLAVCEFKKIPTVLANGRMSERSAKGYARLSAITKPMLKSVSFIAAQSVDDAKRFVNLGADAKRVEATGSIKFDVSITESVLARRDALIAQLNTAGRRVVVFASTHPGEDEQIVPMLSRLLSNTSDALAIIVPRHPERFVPVTQLVQKAGLSCVTLSSNQVASVQTQVVIADTMGDMLAIYGLAEVAFIGGSLIEHGGHNMLEAAAWAVPIVSGPAVFNFQSVVDSLQENQAMTLVDNIAGLEKVLADHLSGRQSLASFGAAAKSVLEANQGALARLLSITERFIK